jgi:hypothetical protein
MRKHPDLVRAGVVLLSALCIGGFAYAQLFLVMLAPFALGLATIITWTDNKQGRA